MEGSANNVLPFFVPSREVFVRPYCNTDFGLCPDRSWTSSKPRPTGCWRTVAEVSKIKLTRVGAIIDRPSERKKYKPLTLGEVARFSVTERAFPPLSPASRELPLRGSLLLTPTIRSLSVGRGFEEVYKRAGHKPESVLQCGYAKTPLRGIEKGSTLFALPSMGSNPFCWGVLGELEGTFPKVPSNKSRPLKPPPRKGAFLF